jgi:uncharacterized protein (TIGR02145 family)
MKNLRQSLICNLNAIFSGLILSLSSISAQIPGSLSYQMVVRDASGVIMANEDISINISVLQGSASGSSVYSETFYKTTTSQGVVNIEIGSGNPAGFDSIDWSNEPYFLKTEVDGAEIGTTQFLSVPFALYSKKSQTGDILEKLGIIPENYSGIVTDIEGNIYKTIIVGTQTWMAENLRTGFLNDSTNLTWITDDAEWESSTEPSYCFYGYGFSNTYVSVTCGALYNWHTVYTNKLCPVDWHVPTYTEWTKLINYLGGEEVAGGKLKESGTYHWDKPNADAINEINFTALPGGYRNEDGSFNLIGNHGYWWTASLDLPPNAGYIGLTCNNGHAYRATMNIHSGFSVRCVKD